MCRIEKRIIVDAGLERVFSYVPEAADSPEIWPGLLEAGEVEHLPGGGALAHWLYLPASTIFSDSHDHAEPLVDRHHAPATLGDIACAIKWNFQPDTHSPRITLDGDYTYWSMC